MSSDGDFRDVAWSEWRTKVEAELKGADFERSLVREHSAGFKLAPLYGADALRAGELSANPAAPGSWPFVRGTSARAQSSSWERLASAHSSDPDSANAELKAALAGGANAIFLHASRAVRLGLDPAQAPGPGLTFASSAELEKVLAGIDASDLPIVLGPGARAALAGSYVREWAQRSGAAANGLRVRFGVDPLGTLARDGALHASIEASQAELNELATECAGSMPKSRAVGVDSSAYHRGGANPALELALSLATAVHYLRSMEASGLELSKAADQIAFHFDVGSELFTEIAKLRAARLLFARVLGAAGITTIEPFIQVSTSPRSLSRIDPAVNILRTTSGVFAGVCGGADAIACAAYDAVLGQDTPRGRRLARNTQLILDRECHLAQVIDPGGGSYYIEALTDDLARSAWTIFQELEGEGGMLQALLEGGVHKRVAASAEARRRKLRTRKLAQVGVSEFPAANESAPTGGTHNSLKSKNTPEAGHPKGCARLDPIPMQRDAADFEGLRQQADVRAAQGKRPSIFLANLGPRARHNPRTEFARNAFAAGGFDVIDGESSGDAAPREAAYVLATRWSESGADFACICGHDEDYEASAAALAAALDGLGAKAVCLAGKGGAHKVQLEAAGVGFFLHAGCDLVALIEALLERSACAQEQTTP